MATLWLAGMMALGPKRTTSSSVWHSILLPLALVVTIGGQLSQANDFEGKLVIVDMSIAPDDASCTKPGLQLGLDQFHFDTRQLIINEFT